MEAGTASAGGLGRTTPAMDGTSRTVRALSITADPGPLGLAGFALTTFVLSMFNTQLVDKAGEPVVLGLALAYGGFAQVLGGMWGGPPGGTVSAPAVSSFGALLVSFLGPGAVKRKGISP